VKETWIASAISPNNDEDTNEQTTDNADGPPADAQI
jgi:hypothetical protein